MNASLKRSTLQRIIIFFPFLFSPILFAANVSIYLSPPRVQETFNADSVVESFNSLRTGPMAAETSLAIGSLENPTATAKVVDGSLTGGARLSKYVMGSPFKIKFEYPTSYLGFWWSTMDADNQIELYDISDSLILRLDGSQVSKFFAKHSTVTNGDGTVYSALSYNGNPSVDHKIAIKKNRYTLDLKYLYCNIFVDGPERISSMVVRKGLFEIDNIAISTKYAEPDSSMVPMFSYDY